MIRVYGTSSLLRTATSELYVRESFCESGEGVRLPRERGGPPGKSGNFRGSLGNVWGSQGNFRGTPGLLFSSTSRELPGKSPKNFRGSSGNFRGSRGTSQKLGPDSLTVTRHFVVGTVCAGVPHLLLISFAVEFEHSWQFSLSTWREVAEAAAAVVEGHPSAPPGLRDSRCYRDCDPCPRDRPHFGPPARNGTKKKTEKCIWPQRENGGKMAESGKIGPEKRVKEWQFSHFSAIFPPFSPVGPKPIFRPRFINSLSFGVSYLQLELVCLQLSFFSCSPFRCLLEALFPL